MRKKFLTIIIIIAMLILVGISSLIFYLYYIKEDQVPVLTYHNIVDEKDITKGTVNISKSKFEKQMKYLYDHKYKTLSMEEFYEWKVNNKKIPKKSVLITFDDGWSSFYNVAIPILEKYNMKASVFVIWKYSENCTNSHEDIYMTFDQIKDINEKHSNIEVLSHSYNMHDKYVADSNDYNLYINDMKIVKSLSSTLSNNNIKYYAYPFGHHNKNYIQALKDSDYKLAFTFGPYDFASKNVDNYQIPRLGIFESTNDVKLKLKLFLEM